MEEFNFASYMEDAATKLKDIGHSEENKKFFLISGIAGLEEFIAELPGAQFPALMIVENPEGRISDNSGDNFTDTPSFEFYIAMKYDFGNHIQRKDAKNTCKSIGQKILSKMLNDSRNNLLGLDLMQFDNIPYFPIGPFGDQAIAIYFRFELNQSSKLAYTPNDWNLG